jgi:hypothetical protein
MILIKLERKGKDVTKMANDTQEFDPRVFTAMQNSAPYASYRKTILGKVHVTILNPLTLKPEGILLVGEPKTDERASIDLWSEMEDLYFKRQNKKHFTEGTVIKVQKVEPKETHTIEQYSDEELKEVLKMPFISFNKLLNEVNTTPVLMRMAELAKEMDKSEKFIKVIEARLSAVQLGG